jgi:Reverse transcriptase (RNA-dependent DNA polymerase)
MPKFITNASLDFAKEHIQSYYDTDFFPKPFEFEALWYKWDEVKQHIIKNSLEQIFEAPPVSAPWRKTRGGYRIVHQLEPLDSIVYTAFAYLIGDEVEKARAEAQVACSYRIEIGKGSLFSSGSGFNVYRMRCEHLAEKFSFVLLTDISDFYNQIYLHRLKNAVETATNNLVLATQIEKFLNRLNTNASQGVPVGPAASIVMTEASLIDVDQFIRNHGLDHVRYVDDFRIFADSQRKLDTFLQELALYLYENHRLSLSSEKTKIMPSDEFLKQELNNQYQLEKLEILEEIEVINPYTMEVEDVDYELAEDAGEKLLEALTRIRKFDMLDLGVARAIIRRTKAHYLSDIAEFLLNNLEFFTPVINDLVLYLHQITDDTFIEDYGGKLAEMSAANAFQSKMVRLWMSWYFSEHEKFLSFPTIRRFLYTSEHMLYQARAAIAEKNQAWIKEQKTKLLHYATGHRRAVIYAAQILSKDEREKWLKPLLHGDQMSELEKWVINWVLDGCPRPSEYWDSQDFEF